MRKKSFATIHTRSQVLFRSSRFSVPELSPWISSFKTQAKGSRQEHQPISSPEIFEPLAQPLRSSARGLGIETDRGRPWKIRRVPWPRSAKTPSPPEPGRAFPWFLVAAPWPYRELPFQMVLGWNQTQGALSAVCRLSAFGPG